MAKANPKTETTRAAPRQRRPVATKQNSVPTYRVTEQSYIGNRLVGPGTPHSTVEYWGVPGKYLVPINAAAKANKLAAKEARAEVAENPDALRELDNELQGVVTKSEDFGDDELELTDAERRELEGHAEQTVKDQEQQDKAGGVSRVGVVLQGNPADPEGKAAAADAATAEAAGKGK